jgi:glucosyl-dolichyl phosphate glucuronosyltransferase
VAKMIQLSVVIPTCNRHELLSKLLQSILKQTLPQEYYEIIVVDNGSTDNTRYVFKQYADKIKNMVYIYDDHPGLHVGRHIGLKAARSEILVYVDDDIRAFPTWLEGIAESFKDSATVLVGGNNLPEYETVPPLWADELWSTTPWGKTLIHWSLLDFGLEHQQIDPNYVWGCNFAIRKPVLQDLGGFHPDAMPEHLLKYRGDGETAVTLKLAQKGYKAVFNPKASIYHFVPTSRMTLEYLYKRGYAQGISDSYTKIRYLGEGRDERSLNDSMVLKTKIMIKSIFYREQLCKKVVKRGYRDGYQFHQKEVNKDPELLKWVLKDHYMNLDGEI